MALEWVMIYLRRRSSLAALSFSPADHLDVEDERKGIRERVDGVTGERNGRRTNYEDWRQRWKGCLEEEAKG